MAIRALSGVEEHKGRAAVDLTRFDAWQQLEIRQSRICRVGKHPCERREKLLFPNPAAGFLVLSLETYLALKAKRCSVFHKVGTGKGDL